MSGDMFAAENNQNPLNDDAFFAPNREPKTGIAENDDYAIGRDDGTP